MSFKITIKTYVECFFLAMIIIFALHGAVYGSILNFCLSKVIDYPTPSMYVNFYFWILILLIPISVIHEATHGLFYIVFGGKVKFGFKFIYAYTMEVSGIVIERVKFLWVLMAPLIIISPLSLLLPKGIGGIVYFINLTGSCGDILMALTLCKYNSNSKIIDKPYGFDVI